MATLSWPNITLGITIHYLDPPIPPMQGVETPHLVLTLAQPIVSILVPCYCPSPTHAQLASSAKTKKGFEKGDKVKNTKGNNIFITYYIIKKNTIYKL